MELHTLKATANSRPDKHRKGRGHAAGKGKQAGKGQSGQNKRSGHRLGFEGGQTPWFRRVGKRGFNNVNHIEYQVINLSDLEAVFNNNDTITIEALRSTRLITKNFMPVKLLASGTLTKKLHVQVNAASNSAQKAIEALGGTLEVL